MLGCAMAVAVWVDIGRVYHFSEVIRQHYLGELEIICDGMWTVSIVGHANFPIGGLKYTDGVRAGGVVDEGLSGAIE